MKNGWKEVQLGDVVILNYGKSLTSANRLTGKIPVYSSAGITGYHDTPLVNSEGIIVGRKGSVGTVYYSPIPFFCIDTAYYILPSEDYSLKYMYYRIRSLGLEKLNEDSAVPGLNRDTAYSQTFLLPPLHEQHAIAAVLLCLDDKITNNISVNHHLIAKSETDSSPDIKRGKRVSRRVARLWFSAQLFAIIAIVLLTMPSKSDITLAGGQTNRIVWMFLMGNFACTAPTVPRLIASCPYDDDKKRYRKSEVIPRKFVSFTQFSVRFALSKDE